MRANGLMDLKQSFSKLKLRYLALYYLLIAIVVLGITAIFQFWSPTHLIFPEESTYFLGLLPGVMIDVVFVWFLFRRLQKLDIPLSVFYKAPITKDIYLFIIYFFAPLSLIVNLLVLGQDYIFNGFSYQPFSEPSAINPTGAWIKNATNNHWYWVFNLLSTVHIVFIVPILEELFFRGIVLHRMLTKYSVTTAIFLSAIFFGAVHAHGFLHSSIIGLFLGFVYLQTKSLRDVALWHMLNNGVAMCLLIAYNGDIHSYSHLLLWPALISLVSLPLGIRWLLKNGVRQEAPLF